MTGKIGLRHAALALAALAVCGVLALLAVGVRAGVALRLEEAGIALLVIVASAAGALSLRLVSAEQRALQSRLEHLSTATQASGVSVWSWDAQTRMISAPLGSAVRKRWGGAQSYKAHEYNARYVHPDDRAQLDAGFDRLIHPSSTSKLAIMRYRSLPDQRHIEVRAHAVRDAGGRLLQMIGVSRDVTEEVLAAAELERQAEELRAAERRLQRASLWSLEGHWDLDIPRNTHWRSQSFQMLLGHEAHELVSTAAQARADTHPQDVHAMFDALARQAERGSPIDFHARLLMADGGYRWFHLRGGAERDADGRLLRIAGSARDVHAQKLAEDALREVRARFERAVHGTQDGLWEVDQSGEPRRCWLSPRFHELLGLADGELAEHPDALRALIHEDDLALFDTATRMQIDRGAALDLEVRMRTRVGGYRWFRLRGSPGLDAGGRVIRTSGSMQDVTDAREAREALVQATRAAQAASGAKSAFLATMSHEIRTPMNGIIGMTALLLDTVLGRVQREYAEAIRASANSLLAIINDILDFSKIEAGKLATEVLELDLRALAEDVAALVAVQATQKHLELILSVDPRLPARLRGDAQRIRQCLLNLLGNAIKFTAAGEVVLAVRTLAELEGALRVRFEVRDTGMGIEPGAGSELFEPFTQADSSMTRRYGGTGLGLSIVKRLVELMGGEVGVQSAPASGSTFWFELPLAVEGGVALPASPRIAHGERALLVVPNATLRQVLVEELEREGFVVHAVASGSAGLEAAQQGLIADQPYDLLLIDEQLPDEQSLELLARLDAQVPAIGAPRVLLTRFDRKAEHARLCGLGFSACLAKPVRVRELRECLQRALVPDAQDSGASTLSAELRQAVAAMGLPRQFTGRVLVVEDNSVNQKVAQKFLERLGCTVQLAGDGAEAVALCGLERFDLILMDMQMPVMDGTTATRTIRAREAGGPRVPIVALTANVLAGQFQSCRDAGMDEVLTKPLDAGRLAEVLERFLGVRTPASSQQAAEAGPSLAPPPLDLARLHSLSGDDVVFMQELVATFRASTGALLAELRAGLAAADRAALSRAAHKLKGASDNLGATRLRELAARVEAAATQDPVAVLACEVDAIAVELHELDQFLRSTQLFATLGQRRAS